MPPTASAGIYYCSEVIFLSSALHLVPKFCPIINPSSSSPVLTLMRYLI